MTLTTVGSSERGVDDFTLQGDGDNRSRGFTLVELIVTVAILGTLAGIGGGYYYKYIEKARVVRAIAGVKNMSTSITLYETKNGQFPDSLIDVGYANFLDPWGNPFQYLNLVNVKGKGQMRKDRFTVPLNSDFDLYSVGKDGQSQPPLTAAVSRDDIVRANDGRFIGLAIAY